MKINEYTREQCKNLIIYQNYCRSLTPQRVEFPSNEEFFFKFTDIEKQLKAPFVVYGDMECILKTDRNISTKTFSKANMDNINKS